MRWGCGRESRSVGLKERNICTGRQVSDGVSVAKNWFWAGVAQDYVWCAAEKQRELGFFSLGRRLRRSALLSTAAARRV